MSEKLSLNSKQLVLWVSLFIGLPLFLYTVTTIDVQQLRTIVGRVKLQNLGLYLALSILNLALYTMIWWNFLRTEPGSSSINPGALFNHRMAGFAVSYITPGPRIGGEITRGGLVGKLSAATQQAGTTTAIMEKFCLFLGGLVFNITVVIAALAILPSNLILQITLSIMIAIALFMLIGWYGFVVRSNGTRMLHWLADQFSTEAHDGKKIPQVDIQNYLQKRYKQSVAGVLIAIATKCIIAAQMYVLLAGLQIPITPLEAVFLAAAIDIAYSIPSYMGLGALEAGQTGVLQLIGSSAGAGIITAFSTRLRDILFSGYGLLALVHYTSSDTQNTNSNRSGSKASG